MRVRLNRGRLVPPYSLSAAQDRLRSLNLEIERIKMQLSRAMDERTGDDEWRERAEHTLRLFQSEANQLNNWIVVNEATKAPVASNDDSFYKEIQKFWND